MHGFALIDMIWDNSQNKFVQRTKGKRFRRVPLNQSCLALLRNLFLQGRRAESEHIFSRVDYFSIPHRLFRQILERSGLKAAIERGATFHSTRHTFASKYMRQGGSLYDLQKILGHSSITQTEKYAHFAPEYLAGKTERVSFACATGTIIPTAAANR